MFVNLLIRWASSALALYLVTLFIPGIHVTGIVATFIAALVIGLINSTLGSLIKLITLPIRFVTLGLFSLVINAVMLMVAAALVPGFVVNGFVAAFLGAIALSIVNWLLFTILKREDSK